ncbi:3-oxo-5-alpha-steroid 4-dehydrogenase 2 [Hydra vulgaris]|uniref:3-oxo-5-alpha-steroid 4-dehydrogenase 2 n=1 Tax=Hydra vulgaris TaxID=6087 RepID=UPI001F5EC1AA|nr:3-oxo-5-alpha-steroid 4-dehydrogenase 1-like [Hydra vulgaris]
MEQNLTVFSYKTLEFETFLNLFMQREQEILNSVTTSIFTGGFIVFITTLWLPAPYGRYSYTGKLFLLPISPRFGWFLQELPAFLVPCIVIGSSCLSNSQYKFSRLQLTVLGCFVLHYLIRTFYYSYNINGGKSSPLIGYLLAGSFCFINGYIQSRGMLLSKSTLDDNLTRVVFGILIFLVGLAINVHSDFLLSNLRKPGETDYKIPQGGLFNVVSCANYTGEITEWIGFAIAAWNLYAFSFAYFTMAFLVPRAIRHHRFYQEKFKDYPKNRKAVLPFLL